MIKIYQEYEFPKGYIDTMRMNNVNPLEVRWVVGFDDQNFGIAPLAEKLGKYKRLDMITDNSIYVVYW